MLKAEGKFPSWPIKLVCDRPDIQWKIGEKSGEIELTIDSDAYPGVAWFRMIDETSSSELIPLLVSNLDSMSESEPNNQRENANAITPPVTLCGRLEKGGDLDGFKFAANASERFIISLTGNRILASPMDAIIQISDMQGNVLLQEDDTRGLDPVIRFDAPENGDYLLRVFAFPLTPNSTIGYAGAATFCYSIDIAKAEDFIENYLPLHLPKETSESMPQGSEPPASFRARPYGWNLPSAISPVIAGPTSISPPTTHASGKVGWQWLPELSIEVTESFETSATTEPQSPLKPPFSFSGHLLKEREVDSVVFSASAGLKYRASVNSKRLGYPIDTALTIIDQKSGESIASNDDLSRSDYDSSVDFTPKTDGLFEARVTDTVDGFGPHHAYSLLIHEVTPSYSLSVSKPSYSVNLGESVEIDITVNRKDGFDQTLEVSVRAPEGRELPKGFDCPSVTSEPKGDSAKSLKLKFNAAGEDQYQGPIQIFGRIISQDDPIEYPITLATFSLRPGVNLRQLWLNACSKPK